MLTFEVNDAYAQEIDNLVSSTGFYSSRSEFLKDSIRKNLIEMSTASKELGLINSEAKKLGAKVKQRGGIKQLSQKQRDTLAKKFAKENRLT